MAFNQQIDLSRRDSKTWRTDDSNIATNGFDTGIFDTIQNPRTGDGDFALLQPQSHQMPAQNILAKHNLQIATILLDRCRCDIIRNARAGD